MRWDMDNVLERCPVVIETPVAWGQMDAFRHLNNTAYLMIILFVLSLNLLYPSAINAQADDQKPLPAESRTARACSQSNRRREALMQQAGRQRFTLRRVEFVGLTYTPDEVLRARLIKFQQEGDLFSSAQLVKALNSMSKLRREIYPVRLSDIEVNLNESEQTVDITICFKPKRR